MYTKKFCSKQNIKLTQEKTAKSLLSNFFLTFNTDQVTILGVMQF